MRRHGLMFILLLLTPGLVPAEAKWGADINDGAGPRLLEDVAPVLVRIVRTAEADRAGLIAQAVQDYGRAGIEAIKRFRNPELEPLFLTLAANEDWTVRHRALLALESFGGERALAAALANLDHAAVRLRERAAIACLKLWDGRRLPEVVTARLVAEEDPYVRSCLEALELRAAGKLPLERVHTEVVVTRGDGLMLTPFLSGMNTVAGVAPGYQAKVEARQGGGSAAKLPAAARWCRPLLGYGDEVVSGTSLQPFANLRQNGTVYHTGHDVGACMDGAGYYAAADGVVKLIHSGSDMGTLLVLEHALGGKDVVTSVYMHGGNTVFVKAGERVAAGRLLGTMGLSYSIENGGHYAHLHYGMYPGPFSMTHNYGYKPVSAGLADWHDPEAFLATWVSRTAPIVPEVPRGPPALAKARALLAQGAYGRAYAEAVRAKDAGGAFAARWIEALEAAPAEAAARVERLRAEGFPADALARLGAFAGSLEGIPGCASVAALLVQWKQDEALKIELRAEKDFLATERKAARARDPAKSREAWTQLLEKYADTPIAARIRLRLEAK